MMVEAFIHFPGVELRGRQFPLDFGTLREPSFDEWFALDGTFAYADRKYSRSAPSFWTGKLDVCNQPTENEVLAALSFQTRKLHIAMLLTSLVPLLPTPALSASYIVVRDPAPEVSSVTLKRFGPMEREWIIFGAPLSYHFDEESVASANAVLEMLEPCALNSAFDGVAAALRVLEATARPDSWWGGDGPRYVASEFVRCIAACEGILLPPEDARGDDTLTDLFGTHAALLCDENSANLAAEMAAYSNLYRLRSRLIHGRIGFSDLDEGQCRNLQEGRRLLRKVLLRTLALRSSVPTNVTLLEWLAKHSAGRTKSAATQGTQNE